MTNANKPRLVADPLDDLSALRLGQSDADTVGVKKLLTTVPVRKPGRTGEKSRAFEGRRSATHAADRDHASMKPLATDRRLKCQPAAHRLQIFRLHTLMLRTCHRKRRKV
jgi:hypothetical protein